MDRPIRWFAALVAVPAIVAVVVLLGAGSSVSADASADVVVGWVMGLLQGGAFCWWIVKVV